MWDFSLLGSLVVKKEPDEVVGELSRETRVRMGKGKCGGLR